MRRGFAGEVPLHPFDERLTLGTGNRCRIRAVGAYDRRSARRRRSGRSGCRCTREQVRQAIIYLDPSHMIKWTKKVAESVYRSRKHQDPVTAGLPSRRDRRRTASPVAPAGWRGGPRRQCPRRYGQGRPPTNGPASRGGCLTSDIRAQRRVACFRSCVAVPTAVKRKANVITDPARGTAAKERRADSPLTGWIGRGVHPPHPRRSEGAAIACVSPSTDGCPLGASKTGPRRADGSAGSRRSDRPWLTPPSECAAARSTSQMPAAHVGAHATRSVRFRAA